LQGNELLNVTDSTIRIKLITWGGQMSKECAKEKLHWTGTVISLCSIIPASDRKDRLLK